MEESINRAINAREIKEKLDKTTIMDEVYDTVEALDVETLKLVLKMYVYSNGR